MRPSLKAFYLTIGVISLIYVVGVVSNSNFFNEAFGHTSDDILKPFILLNILGILAFPIIIGLGLVFISAAVISSTIFIIRCLMRVCKDKKIISLALSLRAILAMFILINIGIVIFHSGRSDFFDNTLYGQCLAKAAFGLLFVLAVFWSTLCLAAFFLIYNWMLFGSFSAFVFLSNKLCIIRHKRDWLRLIYIIMSGIIAYLIGLLPYKTAITEFHLMVSVLFGIFVGFLYWFALRLFEARTTEITS